MIAAAALSGLSSTPSHNNSPVNNFGNPNNNSISNPTNKRKFFSGFDGEEQSDSEEFTTQLNNASELPPMPPMPPISRINDNATTTNINTDEDDVQRNKRIRIDNMNSEVSRSEADLILGLTRTPSIE